MNGKRSYENRMKKMSVIIREYRKVDLPVMVEIWNEVVNDGIAFPQTDPLDVDNAADFFASQSFTAVAERDVSGQATSEYDVAETGILVRSKEIVGLYILHPNNIGRCGHIANSSYAVRSSARGLHIGEKLVKHSLAKGKELRFRLLQFNAVVESNASAIHLYEKLGFIRLGTIPEGFMLPDGSYANIVLFYRTL